MSERKASTQTTDILNSITDIIQVIDQEMRIQWVNVPALQIIDLDEDQIIGRLCHQVWNQTMDTCENCPVKQCFTDGQRHESVVQDMNGRFWHIRTSPVVNPTTGNINSVVETRTDHTRIHQLTQSLKASEEQFRNIVETAREGIWHADPFGETVFVNKKMASMLGYSVAELKDRKLTEFLMPNSENDSILGRFEPFNDTGCDFAFRRKDGSRLIAIISQSPLYNDNEICTGILFMVTDITDRKLMENQIIQRDKRLKAQNRQLEQKNIALNEMITQIQKQREIVEGNILDNIERLLLPAIGRLKESGTADHRILENLEKDMKQLTSSFSSSIINKNVSLSNREWEVSNMIRNGLSTKDIADTLGISPKSVENHRNNIRKKLGISQKNINLKAFLNNL